MEYQSSIRTPEEVQAENVRDTIEEELKRRAKLEAKGIQVLTKNGAVILSGRVQSWEERCAIINAVSRAHKIGIKDDLAIKPYF